jgi:hypothetical protein
MNKLINDKISKLIMEGHPQDQAVAMAYSMKNRSKLRGGGYVPEYNLGGYILGGLKTIAGAGLTAFGMPQFGIGLGLSGIGDITGQSRSNRAEDENEELLLEQKQEGIRSMQGNQLSPSYRGGGIISKQRQKNRKFTRSGEYDYESAIKAGLIPDETGHWPSRDPETGLILKGKKHPTFDKTIEGEKEAGYKMYRKDGRIYSKPKYPLGGLVPYGMPNAEVEKEEVSLAPDGSMNKFDLPTHENATVANQVNMEPGTIIFSDELEVEPGITFAKKADKIKKKIEKYEKILNG